MGESQAVTSALVNVQFCWHICLAKCQIKRHAVFWQHARVFSRVPDECGWRFGADLLLAGEFCKHFFVRMLAQQISLRSFVGIGFSQRDQWIAKDHEVRTAAGHVR